MRLPQMSRGRASQFLVEEIGRTDPKRLGDTSNGLERGCPLRAFHLTDISLVAADHLAELLL